MSGDGFPCEHGTFGGRSHPRFGNGSAADADKPLVTHYLRRSCTLHHKKKKKKQKAHTGWFWERGGDADSLTFEVVVVVEAVVDFKVSVEVGLSLILRLLRCFTLGFFEVNYQKKKERKDG